MQSIQACELETVKYAAHVRRVFTFHVSATGRDVSSARIPDQSGLVAGAVPVRQQRFSTQQYDDGRCEQRAARSHANPGRVPLPTNVRGILVSIKRLRAHTRFAIATKGNLIMRRRFFIILGLLAMLAMLVPMAAVGAVSGAVFTTINEAVDDSGHCQNSAINCNIYDSKEVVWLNGGPSANGLSPAGQYFFAVLVPGGQPDPNDLGAKNLSDDFDAYTNRTFTVGASGEVTAYSGSHDLDSGAGAAGSRLGAPDNTAPFIRLFPYADTTNPGGVYIMAVCSLAGGYPVDPRDCKYDAFKVKEENQPPSDLVVNKDAASTTPTFHWTITKDVDKTVVKQIGGTATFNYTVKVNHDAGTGSWSVSGTITVQNLNDFDISNVDVTDSINDPNASCTVTGGSGATIPANGSVEFPYSCSYSAAPAGDNEINTATATWPASYGTPNTSADFILPFTIDSNGIDNCVTVSDPIDPNSPHKFCVGDPGDPNFSFSYPRTVQVPTNGCQSYDNTATFTTNDNGATDLASKTVTVCGPAKTGALTMGFWQNKNGQGIITKANQAALGTWLRQYHPFSNAPSTGLATYVNNIIKAATCTSTSKTCNSMLKAQMLATALDVYFSDGSLGGNKIGAFNGLGNTQQPIGGISIDLTKICAMIDGSGGTATCSGTFENVSSAFGGATSLTVKQMLDYQNTADPAADAGAVWYGQVKATQVLAKDAFDAINNQVAFAP
jgi:hypothetical protein